MKTVFVLVLFIVFLLFNFFSFFLLFLHYSSFMYTTWLFSLWGFLFLSLHSILFVLCICYCCVSVVMNDEFLLAPVWYIQLIKPLLCVFNHFFPLSYYFHHTKKTRNKHTTRWWKVISTQSDNTQTVNNGWKVYVFPPFSCRWIVIWTDAFNLMLMRFPFLWYCLCKVLFNCLVVLQCSIC